MAALCSGCGYRAQSYINDITSVAVPIFDNQTTWREMEFELTNIVQREIKARTPLRLASKPEDADIVLKGEIIKYYKPSLVEDKQDQVIMSASKITVRVFIRDQKSGKDIIEKTNSFQGEFARGVNESLADAEYRGRQNTFEQIGRWVVTLLEDPAR